MLNSEILRSQHRARFNADPALFVAPGRVNLIGEHTDYAEGFVMPAAIDFATLAAISPRTDGKIALYSENYGEERHFDVSAVPTMKASKHWTDYPLGVVSILAGEGHAISGFSLSLWGDVPLGSGLSSSAALEVATALAVLSVLKASYPGPHLRQRPQGSCHAARLPGSELQACADSSQCCVGDREYHGQTFGGRR
jgi:galactokinase